MGKCICGGDIPLSTGGRGRPAQFCSERCASRARKQRQRGSVTENNKRDIIESSFVTKLRSPLPWMGGKFHMASFLLDAFPPASAYDVYVEPFAGACHVLAQKPVGRHYEVINDLNGDLVNFWLQLRSCPQALIEQLDTLPYSRKLHYDYHRSLFDGTELAPLERAARWFYVLQSSFSAQMKPIPTGWKSGPRDTGSGQPHGYHSALALFQAMSTRLRQVEIDNRDFATVIRRYASPRTLFYVDPPYVGVEDYYRRADGGFAREDHQRLAQVLNEVKGYVALSYYEHPLLDELYPRLIWRRLTWKTHKHSQRTRQRKDEAIEVVLCNYPATQASLWEAV